MAVEFSLDFLVQLPHVNGHIQPNEKNFGLRQSAAVTLEQL